MAIKIQVDRVVTLAYRLLDSGGRLLEEKTPETAYQYLHGRGHIVGPVERLLEGKTAGFQAELVVEPRDAYGDYDSGLVAEIPIEHFPKGTDVAVGMKFNTSSPKGTPITVRVVEVSDTLVTVDGNHPLAGVQLVFDVRVLDVRESTVEESETGYVRTGSLPPGSSSLH